MNKLLFGVAVLVTTGPLLAQQPAPRPTARPPATAPKKAAEKALTADEQATAKSLEDQFFPVIWKPKDKRELDGWVFQLNTMARAIAAYKQGKHDDWPLVQKTIETGKPQVGMSVEALTLFFTWGIRADDVIDETEQNFLVKFPLGSRDSDWLVTVNKKRGVTRVTAN